MNRAFCSRRRNDRLLVGRVIPLGRSAADGNQLDTVFSLPASPVTRLPYLDLFDRAPFSLLGQKRSLGA